MSTSWFRFALSHSELASRIFASPGRIAYLSKSKWMFLSAAFGRNSRGAGGGGGGGGAGAGGGGGGGGGAGVATGGGGGGGGGGVTGCGGGGGGGAGAAGAGAAAILDSGRFGQPVSARASASTGTTVRVA